MSDEYYGSFSQGFENSLSDFIRWEASGIAQRASKMCQSPIEVMFFTSFDLALSAKGIPCQTIFGTDKIGYSKFFIAPQFQIGRHRVDFLVGGPNKDSMAVVECDGREFHYVKREQIERDRKRDSELEGIGLKVFRFPGAQISSDPFECAFSVIHWLALQVGEQRGSVE